MGIPRGHCATRSEHCSGNGAHAHPCESGVVSSCWAGSRALTRRQNMADVKLRFHGRFIYADAYYAGARVDRISVIAPQFDPRGFGRHQPLMTIEHRYIEFKENDRVLTTADPTFRVISPSSTEDDLELLVWDLTGVTVTYNSTGPTTMPKGGTEVLSLPELEGVQGRGAVLDPWAVSPQRGGQANAVIEISAGTGATTDPVKDELPMQFATEIGVRAGNIQPVLDPHDPGSPLQKLPADLVTFSVPLARKCLTLTLTSASGETLGTIALKEGASVG